MRIRKKDKEMEDDEILFLAKVSDALAHPARVKIFRFIMAQNKERISVCNKDIVANFDYAQATISQHLKTLVKSGLLDTKKKEKFTYYFVNIGLLMKYVNITKKFQ